MKEIFLKFLRGSWPVAVIAFFVCVFFYPVFQGKVPLPGDFVVGVYFPWLDYKWGFPTGVPVKNPITTDVVSFIYPMQMLAIDMLKNHQWPLWNPYILAGTPLLANFQSAPFSPTNFVYWIFDRLTAWSIQIMLQHFLAATFTYLLLRYWKVSKIASMLGGIVFAFSGFNMIWSQWNGHTLSAAFIPLFLLLVGAWFEKPRWWIGALFSITVAGQVLSGYPQVVFYTAIALCFYWLSFFNRRREWFLKSFGLVIFGFLGLGLSAFQILPGGELLKFSQREVEPHPFEWAFLPISKVITFFAPDYFGNHATQNYWGPQDYTSNTGFVGVISFVLTTFAFPFWRKNKNVLFLFILLFVSLLLAFPTPVSIFFWKSGLFGLNAASAHRSLVLFNLSVALLAGFGADKFLRQKAAIYRAFIFPALVLLGFFLFTIFNLAKLPIHNIEWQKVGLRNLAWPTFVAAISLCLLWFSDKKPKLRSPILWMLLILLAADLFRFGWKFTPFSARNIVFPTTPILDFLQNQPKPFRTTGSKVIPINMRMPYKIETIEGYDAVYPLWISQFIAAITSGKSGTDPVGRYGTIGDETRSALDLVNVRYDVIIKRNNKNQPDPFGEVPIVFDKNRFPVAFEDKSVAVLEDKNVLSRAFVVYDWQDLQGPKVLDNILSERFPLKEKIFLDKPPIAIYDKKSGVWNIDYLNYEDQESLLKVNTNKNGLLFISDTYFPGWKAYVDSKEIPIYRADFAFRAVEVPKGQHEVRFVYHPDSFFNGLKIMWLSALLLLFASLYTLKR